MPQPRSGQSSVNLKGERWQPKALRTNDPRPWGQVQQSTEYEVEWLLWPATWANIRIQTYRPDKTFVFRAIHLPLLINAHCHCIPLVGNSKVSFLFSLRSFYLPSRILQIYYMCFRNGYFQQKYYFILREDNSVILRGLGGVRGKVGLRGYWKFQETCRAGGRWCISSQIWRHIEWAGDCYKMGSLNTALRPCCSCCSASLDYVTSQLFLKCVHVENFQTLALRNTQNITRIKHQLQLRSTSLGSDKH